MGKVIIVAGVVFAAIFPVLALAFDLAAFADGSAFSYAVSAGIGWEFHWRHISNRITVYLLAYVPSEALGAATGSARAAYGLYTLIFFSAPLAGLLATSWLDRTRGKVFTVACAVCTLAVLPLILPFPSELIFSHALFFPALALAQRDGGWRPALALTLVMCALLNTHEGAVILGALVVASTLLAFPKHALLLRAGAAFTLAFGVWLAIRVNVQPSDYVGTAIARAAMYFLMYENWGQRAVFWALSTAALTFALAYLANAMAGWRGVLTVITAGIGCAAAVFALVDPPVHGAQRYGVRIVVLTLLALAAGVASLAHARNERTGQWLLAHEPAWLTARLHRLAAPAVAALIVTFCLHVIEEARFMAAWRVYTNDVRALAMSDSSNPELGDSAFVSTQLLPTRRDEMWWNSTTLYLSIMLAPGFEPRRLVIDPAGGYFWLNCKSATASRDQYSPMPLAARTMVATFNCKNRPGA